MANKALKFTEGEFGFTHDFDVKNEDGTNATLTPFTGARLVIVDGTTSKLDITANLTIVGATVQWAVQSGQTDYNGIFDGVLHLTAAGRLEKVYDFPVIVQKKKV